MGKIDKLLAGWRGLGPSQWAQQTYGWIMPNGRPIVLTDWQHAALDAWWQHRHTTTCLAISNVKKTGKTTVDAILLAWRWLCLPSEHFACANDQDQSTSRQFGMIAEMVKRHPLLSKHTKITAKKLTFMPTSSTLEGLEVDARGRAGANFLTSSFTEVWGICYESGVRMFEEMSPPPGELHGLPALRICDSYSGYEGESTTWHDLCDRGLSGDRLPGDWPIYRTGGLLLFHMEGEDARRRCFRGTPAQAESYYTEQKLSLRPGAWDRQHENKRASSEDVFILPAQWDRLVLDGYRCPVPSKSVTLTAGLDVGIKSDHCAVVTVWSYQNWLYLSPYRIWKPQPGADVDLDAVESYIADLHDKYTLAALHADPYQSIHLLQRLAKHGVKVFEFPQTVGRLTQAGGALFDAIKQGRLIVYAGSDDLRQHVLNCKAKETARGIRLIKDGTKKIDAGVALAMAVCEAEEEKPAGTWAAAVNLDLTDGHVGMHDLSEPVVEQPQRQYLPGSRTSLPSNWRVK